MLQGLQKIIDNTIKQIPLMAKWLANKDLQWSTLEITNESDFMKGAVISQIISQFSCTLMVLYNRPLAVDEIKEIQKITLTRAEEIKKGILNTGI
jgi:hypothetical protein